MENFVYENGLTVKKLDNGDRIYNQLPSGILHELQARIHTVLKDNPKIINDDAWPELFSSMIRVAVDDYFKHIKCEFRVEKKYVERQNVRLGELI